MSGDDLHHDSPKVAERVRAARELRESEEQFRRSIEDAPIPVIMHAEDGEVLQISRTWTELTGYKLDEVPTFDAWLTRAYGHGADAVREHLHALFAGARRTMSIEFPVRTRTGELRHWSFSASAPGTLRDGRRFVVGMALDVTDRRRAEQALRASEERFRTVADLVPDLLWQSEPDGTATWYNARWLEYTGQTLEQARAAGWIGAIHPDERALAAAHLSLGADHGEARVQEYRLRRHDGVYRWFLVREEPLRDDGGRIVRWFGAATDVHAQRMALEEAERLAAVRTAERDTLRRELAAAEEAERRRLARELHDQLGQELTAFALGLEDAERHAAGADADAPLRTRLAQLKALANQMTARARYVALELRPPELDDVGFEHALDTYAREWSARYGIAAEVAISGVSTAVPTEVGSVLYRIAQEALTNVARHAGARQVSVIVEKHAGEVRLVVDDDGGGFDVDAGAARAKADRRLGLAGMRERAALVGGTVAVESAVGRGTTVFVRLPVSGEGDVAAPVGGRRTQGSS